MAEAAVLKDKAVVNKGANARMDSFVGATAVADLVKSTLGPKGMDKIIQNVLPVTSTSGSLLITNDGATILKSMTVNNAAAKIMCDLAKIQDQEVGDGT
ncbi:hypothetical protein AV274_4734, partial [Blastocystis sp. ATCC 50177/Nand II]